MKTYDIIERNYIGTMNLRCIDGSIHGCGSCKGYCNYNGHPGYLTEKMIADKHCVEKGCNYFLSKPKREQKPRRANTARDIVTAASGALARFDGLKVIRAKQDESGKWILYYVEVAEYPPEMIHECISSKCDFIFSLSRLSYSFDTAVQLVFGKIG